MDEVTLHTYPKRTSISMTNRHAIMRTLIVTSKSSDHYTIQPLSRCSRIFLTVNNWKRDWRALSGPRSPAERQTRSNTDHDHDHDHVGQVTKHCGQTSQDQSLSGGDRGQFSLYIRYCQSGGSSTYAADEFALPTVKTGAPSTIARDIPLMLEACMTRMQRLR